MPKVKIKDLEMHYIDKGAGEVVLLIHGNYSSSYWWNKTIDTLSNEFRFIAPDLRGRGDTHGPSDLYTIEMLADDMYELICSIGDIEKLHVVGHSLGGNVALHFAIDHMSMMKSVTALNPGWIHGDIPDELADKERLKQVASDEQLLELTLRNIVAPGLPDDEEWKKLVDSSLKQKLETTLRSGDAFKEYNNPNALKELNKLPVMLVRGEKDIHLSTEVVFNSVAEVIPNAQIIRFKDASHSPNVEIVDEWVKVLKEFIQSNS